MKDLKTEHFKVANISCGGCANTISKTLKKLDGVEEVKVDISEQVVEVAGLDGLNRDAVVKALLEMGYPEATAENGLLLKLRSKGSCVIGKLTTDN